MTSRRPFVAGNWKMNTDRASAVALARAVAEGAASLPAALELAVCPPFVYLDAVGAALRGFSPAARVELGAQDLYHEPNGAFTGEVSAAMLNDLGARIVLAGHSERRHVLGETDELVAKKTRAAAEAGLHCILCVGETLDERQAGRTDAVNERQTRAALAGLTPALASRVTIAYEPVWAIGTGEVATPEQIAAAHALIRKWVGTKLGGDAAATIRILYGGSVTPDNVKGIMASPDVDGVLVGGASLKPDTFLPIIEFETRA